MSLDVQNPLDPSVHEPILSLIERLGAERNVMAYVLHNPESIYDVSLKLTEEDFANSINRTIYGHMLHLMSKGAKINHSTIIALMTKHDGFDVNKADLYLETICKTNTFNMDLACNIEMVKRASVKRQVYDEALLILQDCANDRYDDDVDSFLGKQQQRFLDLSLKVDSADKVKSLSEFVDGFIKEKAANPRRSVGLSTGFAELDEAIGGLQPSRLIVVGARAKTGKSALLMNWAANISIANETPQDILYIDTEMTTEEVMSRLLARESWVPEKLISNGMFVQDVESMGKIRKAREAIKHGRFHHAYLPNFTIEQVVSLARKYRIKYNIKALFFDYIKLSRSDAKANVQRDIQLGLIATTLKDLAGVLEIPVITAVQLNRSAVGEEHMDESMVRGSDEILHYANYLMFLRNKSEKEIEDEGIENGNQILQMMASRHGGDYVAWLKFHKTILRHEEYANIA